MFSSTTSQIFFYPCAPHFLKVGARPPQFLWWHRSWLTALIVMLSATNDSRRKHQLSNNYLHIPHPLKSSAGKKVMCNTNAKLFFQSSISVVCRSENVSKLDTELLFLSNVIFK